MAVPAASAASATRPGGGFSVGAKSVGDSNPTGERRFRMRRNAVFCDHILGNETVRLPGYFRYLKGCYF